MLSAKIESMNRTKIVDIYAKPLEESLQVSGWVKSVRDSGEFAFITLNDGSCFSDLQIVAKKAALKNYDEVVSQNVGAALFVAGELYLTPERPQPFELVASSVRVLGASDASYPIQKKGLSREFLRTQQHLRSRTNLFKAVFRIRSVAAFAIHEFFQKRGFLYVTTPIITTSDAEGAGEMFRVTTLDIDNAPRDAKGRVANKHDFFKTPAYLTVSGQLQAENFAMSFGDVYTFGPTFRAENSNTRRHAAEFWMIEPEMAFCDLSEDMDVAEAMLTYVIKAVLKRCPEEIAFCNTWVDKGLAERLERVCASKFARITYTEAIAILEAAERDGKHFEYAPHWGIDLQTEHERYLTEVHFKKPVFVTDYPSEIKAFYMRANDDGKTVAACDCLVPGIGEIIGGSQREERLELLESRLHELGLDPDAYKYYLDLRRYGSCEHAGFGLGFERLVMYLTGIENIRDVLPHPRTVGSADF